MDIASYMCRICMKDNDNLIFIFEHEEDSSVEPLNLKIQKCTTIKMSPSDGLPDTICLHCIGEIERSYNLQKLAISTNKILTKMFLSDFDSGTAVAVEATTHEAELPRLAKRKRDEDAAYNASLTVRTDIFNILRSRTKQTLKKEPLDVKREDPEDFDEGLEAGFLEELQLEDDDNDDSTMEGEDVGDPQYNEEQLDEMKDDDNDFEELEIQEESEDGEETKPKIKLAQKKGKGQDVLKTVRCQVCSKFILGAANMVRHMKVTHDKYRFECTECDEKFCTAADLNVHTLESHPSDEIEPQFECGICRRKFNHHVSLERHSKLHEQKIKKIAQNISPHSKYKRSYYEARCETCSIDGFNSAEDRRRHHANHNGVYQCKLCDKSFGFDFSYHAHYMNVHQGIKFECDQCKQLFTLRSSLKRHKLTVHSDLFRFSCEFCEKKFKQKVQCEAHTRSIHTKEKPFKCEVCDYRFSDQSTLVKHRKIHARKTTA